MPARPGPRLRARADRDARAGIPLGDILDDSGYAHRDAGAWAIPLRAAGAQLVQDLHPHDRGPKGTHDGAVISNGNLYCPQTPRPLLELGPLARTATREQAADHDRKTAELARYKLGRLTRDDPDGYHRVQCPAAMGKIRCPLRPASMTLDRDRPEILQPPEHPQACCAQQTITVPPDVLAKTAQKHDYPSAAWRRSYARRTGAERGFATAKDPATNDISRGWCRLMGLAPLMLFTTTLLIVRNQRILTPGTPGRKKPSAAPPPGCPRKPGDAAARHSPSSPPRAAIDQLATTTPARHASPPPQTGTTRRQHARKHSTTRRKQPGEHATAHDTAAAPATPERTRMSDPNVKIVPTET